MPIIPFDALTYMKLTTIYSAKYVINSFTLGPVDTNLSISFNYKGELFLIYT